MKRVSRDGPCPVCGRPDWCLSSPDGLSAICPQVETGSVKRCGEARWLHRLDDGFREPRRDTSPIERAPGSTRDFSGDAQRLRQGADQPVRDLAQQLGASSVVLERLGVGWYSRERCWTFPERDGWGQIIGLMRRWADGTKKRFQGSKSGLSYANDWDTENDAVFLVAYLA